MKSALREFVTEFCETYLELLDLTCRYLPPFGWHINLYRLLRDLRNDPTWTVPVKGSHS